jgi:hypothetical protein
MKGSQRQNNQTHSGHMEGWGAGSRVDIMANCKKADMMILHQPFYRYPASGGTEN